MYIIKGNMELSSTAAWRKTRCEAVPEGSTCHEKKERVVLKVCVCSAN